MKKIKISLTVLALVLGMTSAIAFKSPVSSAYQTSFTYVKSGSSNFTGTQAQAQDNYDCHGATSICALAYQQGHAGDPNFRVPSQDIFFNE
jgi:hypothetical protein